jgi:cytochrome subunit of sulfide dehydrogenase
MSFFRLIALAITLFASSCLLAGERNAAVLASACAACHGTQGHSVGGTPSLAGLDSMYFTEQMRMFKQGKRPSTVMMQHASGYTEEEIRLLAEYFAKQK